MITSLAQRAKRSAFSALLAYVLALNVLLAGFAQAAIVDHALNGNAIICTVDGSASDQTQPDKPLQHQCQMCCPAAAGHFAPPPPVASCFARLTVASTLLFPLNDTGLHQLTLSFTKARAPPFA